ncbi:MAG: hypothetical protein WBN23_07125 [Woeseia sp.]
MSRQDKNSSQDDAFLQRAAGVFDDSVENLDAATRSRLNQGRQQALAVSERSALLRKGWIPLGAAAALGLLAIGMWNGRQPPEVFDVADFATPTMASDFEILLDEEELEMLEDLEFYSWIDLDENLMDADLDEHVG